MKKTASKIPSPKESQRETFEKPIPGMAFFAVVVIFFAILRILGLV